MFKNILKHCFKTFLSTIILDCLFSRKYFKWKSTRNLNSCLEKLMKSWRMLLWSYYLCFPVLRRRSMGQYNGPTKLLFCQRFPKDNQLEMNNWNQLLEWNISFEPFACFDMEKCFKTLFCFRIVRFSSFSKKKTFFNNSTCFNLLHLEILPRYILKMYIYMYQYFYNDPWRPDTCGLGCSVTVYSVATLREGPPMGVELASFILVSSSSALNQPLFRRTHKQFFLNKAPL